MTIHYDLTNPEHAYLLGFLLGDGTLSRGPGRKGKLSVELHIRDAAHLRRLQTLLPGSRYTERCRTTNFSQGEYVTAILTCCRLDVREALVAVGMPEGRKDRVATPPSGPLSDRDFARGLVDADGSVGWTAQGLPFVSLVSGSQAIAQWWCGLIFERTGLRRTCRPNARDGAANVMVTSEAAVSLSQWLYQPGDLALRRKADKAGELRTWTRPTGMAVRPKGRPWTPEEDALLAEGTLTHRDMATRLGRTPQAINLRAWRLRNGLT